MSLPKPPKLFHFTPSVSAAQTQTEVPQTSMTPVPADPAAPQVQPWSPTPMATSGETAKPVNSDASMQEPIVSPEPTDNDYIAEPEETPTETGSTREETPATPVSEPAVAPEIMAAIRTPEPEPVMAEPTGPVADISASTTEEAPAATAAPIAPTGTTPVAEEVKPAENITQPVQDPNPERYARPRQEVVEPTPVLEPVADTEPIEADGVLEKKPFISDGSMEATDLLIKELLGKDQKIVRAPSVSSVPFSDIWYTAEHIAYIRDNATQFALVPFEADDLPEFHKALEQGFTGASSYSIRFAGESYRVERIITLSGPQYNCRKMPGSVPDIDTLGLPKHIVEYLLTLSKETGLILFGGPTGMGKTTSASALMKRFLEMEGGFMYTIEDPPEMPLDGLYHAKNGGLGLCKQCPVNNERWGDGIKSALRSKPRYILVGEIRTPETASQVLRAATSGHLVLSTIHASTVEDALESLIKYASGAGLTEELAADLLARGVLAVVHQKLEGMGKLRPVLSTAFANPHLSGGDQMRSLIRSKTINLQTLIEAQSSRLFQGRPLFED